MFLECCYFFAFSDQNFECQMWDSFIMQKLNGFYELAFALCVSE